MVEGRTESPASQQRNRNSGVLGFTLAPLVCFALILRRCVEFSISGSFYGGTRFKSWL